MFFPDKVFKAAEQKIQISERDHPTVMKILLTRRMFINIAAITIIAFTCNLTAVECGIICTLSTLVTIILTHVDFQQFLSWKKRFKNG